MIMIVLIDHKGKFIFDFMVNRNKVQNKTSRQSVIFAIIHLFTVTDPRKRQLKISASSPIPIFMPMRIKSNGTEIEHKTGITSMPGIPRKNTKGAESKG